MSKEGNIGRPGDTKEDKSWCNWLMTATLVSIIFVYIVVCLNTLWTHVLFSFYADLYNMPYGDLPVFMKK